MSGADVQSLEALVALDSALGVFAARQPEIVAQLAADVARQCGRVRRHAEEAVQAVRACEAALGSCPEEEDDYYRIELEAAEERLQWVRHWLERVDEAHAQFEHQARRMRETDDVVRRGRDELQQQIEHLHEYLAVALDIGRDARHAASAPHDAPFLASAEEASVPPSALSRFQLPKGLVWVPITAIDVDRELAEIRGYGDYKKISYDDMRAGLDMLRRDMLPEMHRNPERCTRDFYRLLDEQAGRTPPRSMGAVYDAFFGADRIHVGRRTSRDLYSVDNGRHRIALAREMGWDAVPAEAVTVRLIDDEHP